MVGYDVGSLDVRCGMGCECRTCNLAKGVFFPPFNPMKLESKRESKGTPLSQCHHPKNKAVISLIGPTSGTPREDHLPANS